MTLNQPNTSRNLSQLLLSVVCCLFSAFSFGQKAAIQLTHGNVLLLNEPTEIKVAISDIQSERVVFKTSNNLEHSLTDTGSFITAKKRGRGLITLGYIKRKDTIWVDSLNLVVKQLPKPKVKLGTIESGTTIARQAVAIHRSLRVGYKLYGITPLQRWKVVSYRIIIANAKSYHSYRCKGPEIPMYVRDDIARSSGGRVLVDQIKSINTTTNEIKNLAPIIIYLDNGKNVNRIAYVNASFTNKSGTPNQYENVTSYNKINTLFNTIDSGTITTFAPEYRMKFKYSNGINYFKGNYDNSGNLLYSLTRISDYLWDFKKLNASGHIVLETTISDTLIFFGAKEVELFINNSWFGLPDTSKRVEYDLVSFYQKNHYTPIDSFTTRYNDGAKRVTGFLKVRVGTHEPWDSPRCGNIGIEEFVEDISVMHGKWTYYNQAGEIIEQRMYDMGKLVKE
ncbi:MAG: hypothetical protein ACI8SE_001211 [Bacteroidia bacterium]